MQSESGKGSVIIFESGWLVMVQYYSLVFGVLIIRNVETRKSFPAARTHTQSSVKCSKAIKSSFSSLPHKTSLGLPNPTSYLSVL